MSELARPVRGLASWLGGWGRLALLVLAIAGIAYGFYWQSQRHPPVPPGATQVATSLQPGLRQTNFRYAGSVDEIRAWYRQHLAERGWSYCGTQATEGCTNMQTVAEQFAAEVDVFRRAGDENKQGTTIEIWPQQAEGGEIFVTILETRAP